MVSAVVCGLLSGVVGFLPLYVGLRATKRVASTNNLKHMVILFSCLAVSFVIMFALAMACASIARDYVLPFVLAEALALSVSAITCGILRTRSTK